ncbi:MAG: BlaI/MecI/CopY family transcriptional regulator [Acidobacteriota bacterium]
MAGRISRISFDPRKKGLKRVLGELESQIMEILWSLSEATVRQVHARLQERRKIAYTTVMTVMSRLAEKGLLERRKEGNAYVYQPLSSRREFTHSVVGSVIASLIRDFGTPTMTQFLESVEEEDPESIEELARLIEERRGRDV